MWNQCGKCSGDIHSSYVARLFTAIHHFPAFCASAIFAPALRSSSASGIALARIGPWGVDPIELLRMINGRSLPTKAIVAGLARELDSDVRYLEKLAEEIRNDLAVK
jgi:hypothetical protein